MFYPTHVTAVPILPNSRREKFCQALAEGKTAHEAYVLAGYKPNRANAPVLKSKQNIAARVVELQTGGADRAQVTVKSIIENLKRIAKKAENLGDARGLQAARASWEGIARISGLIVERGEVGDPGEFARMRYRPGADHDALGHAATTTGRWISGHEHQEHSVAALAHVAQA